MIRNSLILFFKNEQNHRVDFILLDTPVSAEKDDLCIGDAIEDDGAQKPYLALETVEDLQKVLRKFNHFMPRHQLIFCQYYGICGFRQSTQIEIASHFGFSRSAINSIVIKMFKNSF